MLAIPVCALGRGNKDIGDRGGNQLVSLPVGFKPPLHNAVEYDDR
ncbi:MAG: hypothetical protein WB698_00145 [Solirubrobacteraceae bacterium]